MEQPLAGRSHSLHFFQTEPDPSPATAGSGFRLRAPAPLTPAKRLKFDPASRHHHCMEQPLAGRSHSLHFFQTEPDPSPATAGSGFRLRAPAPLTPAKRLKFDPASRHHHCMEQPLAGRPSAAISAIILETFAARLKSCPDTRPVDSGLCCPTLPRWGCGRMGHPISCGG